MEKKKVDKRGQLKISFGMLFSIILIIIFLSFAFYAIQKFLELKDTTQVAKFENDLQGDVDKVWRGNQASRTREYILPTSIDFVCFIDYPNGGGRIYEELEQFFYSDENLFFYPIGSAQGRDSKRIKHIDLDKITQNENPFCIENVKGKVNLIIKKDFGEAEVTIEKQNE